MNGNGQAMPVIGRIEIIMTANGNIQAQFQVPNRQLMNAMMETAKQDILEKLKKAEKQKVVVPELRIDL
jgi:hypothetical protein